jgi:hypothetical protein
MVGLHILTQDRHAFLQVIDAITVLENHTIDRDNTVVGKILNQAIHGLTSFFS